MGRDQLDIWQDDYDDMVEAWDRLDQRWQTCVRVIKRDYMHLIKAE